MSDDERKANNVPEGQVVLEIDVWIPDVDVVCFISSNFRKPTLVTLTPADKLAVAIRFDDNVNLNAKAVICQHEDGAIKVAEYIVEEIKTNTKSVEAENMRKIAHLTPIVIPLWAKMVASGKPWDHKPEIKERFAHIAVEREKQTSTGKTILYKSFYHKYKDYDYFYDVWSNIHYGYVGRSIGLGEITLLGGADLAQIIDTRARNLRDTPDDKTSIKIGFELYKKYGIYAEKLTKEDILERLNVADMRESKKIHVCQEVR